MATRRYHKKRVGRKSRKSGKVGRKSRRVGGGKLMKGGGLVSQTGVKIDLNTIPPDPDTGFKFLDGYIRTKTGFEVYKIGINNSDTENPTMTWTPIAGAALKYASVAKNAVVKAFTFGYYGKSPLEEFKLHINDIYNQDLVDDSDIPLSKISNLNSQDTVVLNKTGISIGDVFYHTKTAVPAREFKTNVVNMYKKLSD